MNGQRSFMVARATATSVFSRGSVHTPLAALSMEPQLISFALASQAIPGEWK